MGKKNLSALMDGLMGAQEQESEPKAPEVKEPIPSTPVSGNDSKQKELPAEEKSKRGRPSKSGYTVSTYKIEDNNLKKMKYIAYVEDCNKMDIINDALRLYFEKWESENGPIPKKMLK